MILTGFADPEESAPSVDGRGDRRSASWSVPPPALAGLEDQPPPSARPSAPPPSVPPPSRED